MVPPGDGLEFQLSSLYRSRVKIAPEIDLAIRKEIRNKVNAGIEVAGPARELTLRIGIETYVVFSPVLPGKLDWPLFILKLNRERYQLAEMH